MIFKEATLCPTRYRHFSAAAPLHTPWPSRPGLPEGDQIGVAADSRYNLNWFVEDTWKISDRLSIDYGLRYELYWPITERAKRSAGVAFVSGPNGPSQEYLINPQPTFRLQGNNWGP